MLAAIKENILLFFGLFLAMTLDISLYFIDSHLQLSFILFSLLIPLFWYRPSIIALVAGPLFLATESFVIYQEQWWPFILAIAILALCPLLKTKIYGSPALPTLLGGVYVGIMYALQAYWGRYYPATPYTIGILFANLILILIFSLKLQTSKTGQSLTPLA